MTTLTRQAREDEVSDVSIDRLVLDVATRGKNGLSRPVTDLIFGGKVEQTMIGASEVQLQILDRDYEALKSGVFGTRVRTVVDGVPFHLTTVSLVDVERLTLTFEHSL